MNRALASAGGRRFRSAPFLVLLLVSTFALSLHVQLAKYDKLAAFPGSHILHGDLIPDGDKPAQVFTGVPEMPVLALIANLLGISLPRVNLDSVLLSDETSVREFLNYLALFVRPPPVLAIAVS